MKQNHFKLFILASGDLGLHCLKEIHRHHQVALVFTDKSSQAIQDFCHQNGLSFRAGNPNSTQALEMVEASDFDLAFSINFIFLLKEEFLSLLKVPVLNIHGSLLPAYRGRTPHVWAIIHGEDQVGITVHKVDSGCDTGDILLQQIIPLSSEDTGGSVLQKFRESYPDLILQAIDLIRLNKANFTSQDEAKASHFPKRTPEDGQLNFAWDSARIVNWVRAQTRPYPGAFCYYKEKKMIIWRVRPSESMAEAQVPGTILETGPHHLLVKSGDGTILIEDWDCAISDFKIGEKLSH